MTRTELVPTPGLGSAPSGRALDAGANEYIMKPFDKDIVAAKFQEVGLFELAPPTSV